LSEEKNGEGERGVANSMEKELNLSRPLAGQRRVGSKKLSAGGT